MRKLLILAVLPLTLSACTSNRCCCPDCGKCACATCNPHTPTLTPPPPSAPSAPAAPSVAAPAPTPAVAPTASTKVYRIAPAKLVETIQQAITAEPLNLKILSAENGVIQTDWKAYEGEFHIARRWEDRTRYRISVIPDVNDPINASRFEVAEETQRRSNDRANWTASEDRHPERVAAVTQAITARLQ